MRENKDLAKCENCPLSKQCSLKVVPAEVGANYERHRARMVLIGEGPGRAELLHGRPFVGMAGRLLDALLDYVGLSRDDVAFVNATLGFPGAEGLSEQALSEAALACRPRLLDTLKQLEPSVVVVLGRVASTGFFGRFSDPLVGRRGVAGAVFEAPEDLALDPAPHVVVTYHPAFCLRSEDGGRSRGVVGGQFAARVLAEHLRKAKRIGETGTTRWSFRHEVSSDARVVLEWYVRNRGRTIAYDVETDAKDAWDVTQITCIGLCADAGDALVVDTRDASDDLLDAIQTVLEDPETPKVAHNGGYDRIVIRRIWGMEVFGTTSDTLALHRLLWPDEEHNLGFVAHELLDAPAWKHEGEEAAEFETLAAYNAKDVVATISVYREMEARVRPERLSRAHELLPKLLDAAHDMNIRGIHLDRAQLEEYASDVRKRQAETLEELRHLCGSRDFTPTDAWIRWALFDANGPFKLPPIRKTAKKGVAATSKEALAHYAEHPFVKALLEHRRASYVLSNYVESRNTRPAADGRIHPFWSPGAAVTGRWTSKPNVQNWPKTERLNMRAFVTAPPGRAIVGADYDQLELRVMACISGDRALVDRVERADPNDKLNPDKDPHAFIASTAFGRAFQDAEKNTKKALRDVAKRVVYGLAYGAGAETVLRAIEDSDYDGPPLTVSIVSSVIQTFFTLFSDVAAWRTEQVRRVHRDREVRSCVLGRRRVFPLGEVEPTVAVNYPIQATASDVVDLALLDILEGLPDVDPTAFVFALVHDAVYLECDEGRADAVAELLNERLPTELQVQGGPKVVLTASAAVAKRWDQA